MAHWKLNQCNLEVPASLQPPLESCAGAMFLWSEFDAACSGCASDCGPTAAMVADSAPTLIAGFGNCTADSEYYRLSQMGSSMIYQNVHYHLSRCELEVPWERFDLSTCEVSAMITSSMQDTC